MAQKNPDPRASSPKISDEAVREKTGRTWPEWFDLLDGAGAASRPRKEIVGILASEGVPPWWCQMVTVEYERARGLRAKYQTPEGFQASASKTVKVPLSTLFAAWSQPEQRAKWIGEAEIAIHRMTEDKSIRAKWPPLDSPVEVNFYSKGEDKSQVTIGQRKLPSAEDSEKVKAMWRSALARLAEFVER